MEGDFDLLCTLLRSLSADHPLFCSLDTVFSHRGLDPTKVGWAWTGLTHETLVVDWDTSEGKRYLIDVGFGGGGNPFP